MRPVIAALEERGWPWYLTGSEALAAYGAPRQTMDTDLVVEAPLGDLDALAASLLDSFLYAEPIHVGRRWMASLIDRASVGKVDLIVRDPDAWGTEAMRRRRPWDHPAWGAIWVSTLEDLILAKLEWSEGVSELQLRDCASLLRMNRATVEDAYLDRWSQSLGIVQLLEAARRAP